MSIFKVSVKDRTGDSKRRLVRLIKYTDGKVRELIKLCVQQPTHPGYQNAKMVLEKRYGDPYRLYASYRKETVKWLPIKYRDAKSYQESFNFLNKCNILGAATKWNAMETPDTLCILVSKLPDAVTDRWKRKTLISSCHVQVFIL